VKKMAKKGLTGTPKKSQNGTGEPAGGRTGCLPGQDSDNKGLDDRIRDQDRDEQQTGNGARPSKKGGL